MTILTRDRGKPPNSHSMTLCQLLIYLHPKLNVVLSHQARPDLIKTNQASTGE